MESKIYIIIVVTLLFGICLGVPFGQSTTVTVGINHWTHDDEDGFLYPTNTTDNVSLNNNSLLWANLSGYAGTNISWSDNQFHVSANGTSKWNDNGIDTLFTNIDGRDVQVNGTVTADNLVSGGLTLSGDLDMGTNDIDNVNDLDVDNDIHVGDKLEHLGDADTYLDFNANQILFYAGGTEILDMITTLATFGVNLDLDSNKLLNANLTEYTSSDVYLDNDKLMTNASGSGDSLWNESGSTYFTGTNYRSVQVNGTVNGTDGEFAEDVHVGDDIFADVAYLRIASIESSLLHAGDPDTFLHFGNDDAYFSVGGNIVLRMSPALSTFRTDVDLNGNYLWGVNLSNVTSSDIFIDDGKLMTNATGGGLVDWTDGDPYWNATDTESELEAHIGDVTDIFTDNDGALDDDDLSDNTSTQLSDTADLLYEAELDDESELEAQLGDVTDVYTDNDFTDNSGNWDTAYGWGDHGIVGYLTSASLLWNLDDAVGKIYPSSNYDVGMNGTLSVDGETYLNNSLNMNGNYLWGVNLSNVTSSDVFIDDGKFYLNETGWLQNGFTNTVDSSISFIDGNRTFLISPVAGSFDYYIASVRYTVDESDTVIIDDTEGIWYIYYDGSTLTALHSPTHAQLETLYLDTAVVGIVYWDADNSKGQLLEERHGLSMSPYTHLYLHETVGTRYSFGLALNSILADEDGDTNTHAQFGTDTGEIFDEDLKININAVGSTTGLQIWHRDTTLWTFTTNAGYSMLTTGSGRLAYDNAGTLTEVTNGDFVLCHVFTGSFTHNNPVVAIGQAEYASKKLAQEGAITEINNIVSIADIAPELKPIATVIFQTSNSYGNSVKARIVSTDEGDDYVDWTASDLSPGRAAADHGNLAGLGDNDHPQYLTDWTDGDPYWNVSDAFDLTWAIMASYWNVSDGDPHFNASDAKDFVWETVAGYWNVSDGDPFFNVSDAFDFAWGTLPDAWNESYLSRDNGRLYTSTDGDDVQFNNSLFLDNNTLLFANLTEYTSSDIYLDNDKLMTNATGGGDSLWSLDDAVDKIYSSNNYDAEVNGTVSIDGETFINDTLNAGSDINLTGNKYVRLYEATGSVGLYTYSTIRTIPFGAYTADGLLAAGMAFDGTSNKVVIFQQATDRHWWNVAGSSEYFTWGGVKIGTDDADHWIDDSTHAGNPVDQIYIADETIDTSAPSDIRLKENIRPTRFGLDTILGLEYKDFQFIDFKDEHTGLIANQVLDVIPEIVSTRNDGFLKVGYKALIPINGRAIQELHGIIEEQNNTIQDQQDIIDSQQEQIDNNSERLDRIERIPFVRVFI